MEKGIAAKPIFGDKRRRVWELDFLRGVAVIAMCFDHLMFDVSHPGNFFSNVRSVKNAFAARAYDFAWQYWIGTASFGFRFWAHYLFVFLFLFLVGTSCAFSRDNTRRGALTAIVAIVFTGISYVCKAIGVMQYGIVFGILHCIALSILCAAALDILTSFDKRVNFYVPLAVGAAILFAGVLNRFWDMASPYDRVFTGNHFVGYILGVNGYGDDWFGLFPNVGAVILGMCFGKVAYPWRQSLLPALDGKWNRPITFVGRHALIFYFLHQVVLAGLYVLVWLCLGYRL